MMYKEKGRQDRDGIHEAWLMNRFEHAIPSHKPCMKSRSKCACVSVCLSASYLPSRMLSSSVASLLPTLSDLVGDESGVACLFHAHGRNSQVMLASTNRTLWVAAMRLRTLRLECNQHAVVYTMANGTMTPAASDPFASAAAQALGCLALKPEQMQVVTGVLRGRDVFAVLPTGFAKTLCYAVLPGAFDYSILAVPRQLCWLCRPWQPSWKTRLVHRSKK